MTDRSKRIRALLLKHIDGLTVPEIAEQVGGDVEVVRQSICRMPDTYIDRWVIQQADGSYAERPSAVYCVVTPPEDCPRPRIKRERNKK